MTQQRKHVEIFHRRGLFRQPWPWRVGVRCCVTKETPGSSAGGERETTNNRMELTAVIEALSALKEPCDVTLTSDSSMSSTPSRRDGSTAGRKRLGQKSDKKPAPQCGLVGTAAPAPGLPPGGVCWVKGHAGHPENERCDQMAVAQSEKHKG